MGYTPPPQNRWVHDGFPESEYPKKYKRYRICEITTNKEQYYEVQCNKKILFFFNHWIPVGPCKFEYTADARKWISDTVNRNTEGRRIVWTGYDI